MSADRVDVALDNDVVLKAVCLELTLDFWPPEDSLGVLGAAPYVLGTAITRSGIRGNRDALSTALQEFLGRTVRFEPSEAEVAFAADLELLAQKHQLELDTGEAQLAAMVVERAITALDTGDKRAITALERLLGLAPRLEVLRRRVRCLEQLVVRGLGEDAYQRIRAGICAELDLDRTLSICFGCVSGRDPGLAGVAEALGSYIEDLRRQAPNVLTA